MRGWVVALVVIAALAVAAGAAADNATITAKDNFFDPSGVTIRAGDRVTFAIEDGSVDHNFDFGNEAYPATPSPPGAAWANLGKTFTQPGTYAFVCAAHAEMTGTITVLEATSTATSTATATATSTSTAQPTTQLEVRTLRVSGSTFCTKRGPKCRRPGVKVRIDVSQPADVTGTLARRPPRGKAKAKSFGHVRFGTVAAGIRTLTFAKNAAGKRLTAGRYALKLTIAGRARQTLRFKVR